MVYKGALTAPWPCEQDGRSTVPDPDRAQVDRVTQALRYSSSQRPRPVTSSRPCARAYHHETSTSSTRPPWTASLGSARAARHSAQHRAQTQQAPGSPQATAKRRTSTSAHQTSATCRETRSHSHGTRGAETRHRRRLHSATHPRHSHQTHRPLSLDPQTHSQSHPAPAQPKAAPEILQTQARQELQKRQESVDKKDLPDVAFRLPFPAIYKQGNMPWSRSCTGIHHSHWSTVLPLCSEDRKEGWRCTDTAARDRHPGSSGAVGTPESSAARSDAPGPAGEPAPGFRQALQSQVYRLP